jgi:hypothetical protein
LIEGSSKPPLRKSPLGRGVPGRAGCVGGPYAEKNLFSV